MREDLENINILLLRFVGNGCQLAICNVGWLTTQESGVLVPDPIVLAQWSVVLDRGEPCDSCQDTSDEAASACFLRQAYEVCPFTGETRSVCAPSL